MALGSTNGFSAFGIPEMALENREYVEEEIS
jgi:hypothetical protein